MSRQFSQAVVGRDALSTGIVICIGWGWEDGTVLGRKGEVGSVAREEMAFCQETYFFSIMVLLLKYSQFYIIRFLPLIGKIKIN